jgi:glycosyltransferase involved in cell wall biosynthesis
MIIKLISVIIPCFNEDKTIEIIVEKVQKYKSHPLEIIIVDDCSIDNTPLIIQKFVSIYPNIKTFRHNINQGKGAAVCTGIKHATGDVIIIQDADLEYDPYDYTALIEPFLKTDADVVYGTRFKGASYTRLHFFWHYLANKILTIMTNVVTNLNMSDMETGYKLFKTEIVKNLIFKEKSFGIEPEITIKLAKKKYIFYEVPISYNGRSYDQGKKITLKDAFIAIYCIFRYRWFS